MRILFVAALFAAPSLAGCVRDRDVEGPPAPPDPVCTGEQPFPDLGYYLAFDTDVHRQGATIRITPRAARPPAGTRELPMHCTSDWAITGPATLSPDRRSITIAPDAPPGSAIRISYRAVTGPVQQTIVVIGRDEVVLTGTRGQRSVEGCDVSMPVGELEFSVGNRFAVTFQPFETYKDYWGSYSFDPATGRLVMTVSGGNFQPPGLDLDGTARIEGNRLILEGMYLGSRDGRPPPAAGCRYVF